jgi:D-threo-aldose 1-dehydrogenase
VTSTIVGMSRPERIEETMRLAAIPIPQDLWDAFDALPVTARAPTEEPAG